VSVLTFVGYLFFSHSPMHSLNFHELLMNFMWMSAAFLILLTAVLGALQLMSLMGLKQHSTHSFKKL
jgi:hypothetical protein